MGVPIVNTPFTRDSVAAGIPSLLQQTWNSAPSGDGRELPPYPRHYPGPWLGPLSFAACHQPVVSPGIVETVGVFVTMTKRRTACPSSDGITRDEDGPCSEDRRDCCSPWTTLWEGPTTRELAHPPPTQCCEVRYDGPMQFAFAGPLHLPTLKSRVTATRPISNQRGLPTLRQATCRTLW